jgi:histidine triad (HIT) family protein
MVDIGSEEDMEEKLGRMSSEQMKEYQKQNCIFCQIVLGKVKSKKVYEDEKCIAVLDINPATPGHVLLLPKEHYSIMPQMPEHETGHLFIVSKAISSAMLKGLKVSGTNIFVANGAGAGQRAQHFMIHIIPRKEDDGLSSLMIPQRQMPESDLEMIRKGMAEAVARAFGKKAEEKTPETKEEQKKENREERKPEAAGEEKKSGEKKSSEAETEQQKQKSEEKQGGAEKKQQKKAKTDVKKQNLDKIAGLFK